MRRTGFHPSAPRSSRAWPLRACAAGALLPILSCCVVAPAKAQVAFSASLTSDYRFRGISLSDRKPALSVTVTYDHPSGAYFGLSAIGAETARSGVQALGYQAYVGYAGRFRSGPSWDVGVTNANITEYFRRTYRLNYTEVYAGLVGRNLSAHVYYSPNYLGEGVETIYVDVDGAIHPARRWRLFAHAGLLTPLDGRSRSEISGPQYDLRAGVARRIGPCELQLAWTRTGPDADYPAYQTQTRDALVVSAAYFF